MRSVFDLKDNFRIGMHGCGYYAGSIHANTYEGFKYWQRKGVKIMEIDISKTIDGKYVALAHKMSPMYLHRLEICDYSDKNAFTCDWFLHQKLFRYSTFRGLHSMDVAQVILEMTEDHELIVMFDLYGLWSKDETFDFTCYLCDLAKQNPGLLCRTIVEAYNQDMIDGVKRAANESVPIIYCVRDDNNKEHQWKSPSELLAQKIKIVSYPWRYMSVYPGEVTKFNKDNFILFSYCADNRDVECAYQKQLVNVVLVDNVINQNRRAIYVLRRLINRLVQKIIRKVMQ